MPKKRTFLLLAIFILTLGISFFLTWYLIFQNKSFALKSEYPGWRVRVDSKKNIENAIQESSILEKNKVEKIEIVLTPEISQETFKINAQPNVLVLATQDQNRLVLYFTFNEDLKKYQDRQDSLSDLVSLAFLQAVNGLRQKETGKWNYGLDIEKTRGLSDTVFKEKVTLFKITGPTR